MLLAEGKITSYEKGEIVVKLLAEHGANEEEALIAATGAQDIQAAVGLLRQECQLCMSAMKITEV